MPPAEDIARRNDKVRVKTAPHRGIRGIVADVEGEQLRVALESGETVVVEAKEVTNYSLAARRAWQAMPSRAVGRPKSPGPAKKTVSLRVDADVWRRLGEAVQQGLIPSREQAINLWLREKLVALLDANADHM